MDHLFWGVTAFFIVSLSVFSAGHALIIKRDPRSALGWIVVCLTLPGLGPILYWSMGVNRISRKAQQWLESGRRLAGWDAFRSRQTPEKAVSFPQAFSHFKDLRSLADRVVSYPLVASNNILPMKNGENVYPAMLDAIAGARHSVHLSTYIFDGDVTGRRFAEALKAAAERGAEVRVIIDGLGEKYSIPRARTLFKGSGVKVARFLPMRQGGYINLRNHRKILVVDGCKAFTGGMNIGDRHMVERGSGPPVVDMHFMLEGPVVVELQQAFLEDWYFVTRELLDDRRFFPGISPAGPALVRAISDGPDKEFRKLHCIIMGALSCARERVQIMTPYFIPDNAMISALATAALRGVDVTLVLPAMNNLPFVHWATRAYLWELLEQGIRIYYQPPPFVHTKLFIVDGAWSLIGSANLDPRSLRLNFELNLEVYDCDFAGLLGRHFEDTLAVSREVTIDEVNGWSLPVRLRDSAAKLFSPYL